MKRVVFSLFLLSLIPALPAQQAADKFKPLLIDLSGWNAENAEGMDASFGNIKVISATRDYERGDATLTASVLIGQAAASYQVQKMTYETDEGFFRSDEINNFPVYISFDKTEKSGAIIVHLAASPQSAVFVLTFESLDWNTALGLAKKFDWDAMKTIAEGIK